MIIVLHMLGKTVQDTAHLHRYPSIGYIFVKNCGAVWFLEDGLGHIFAHFTVVDVKSRHHFYVVRPVSANIPMHDADGIFSALVTIVMDSLNQGTSAVSKSNNAYFRTPHLFTSAISV